MQHAKAWSTLHGQAKQDEADLPLLANPDASADQLRVALDGKLANIDQRIAGLQALRGELARRLGQNMAACPLQATLTA